MASSDTSDLFTIRNKRYRVPAAFMDSHPGGRDMITLGVGRNCTEMFVSYHSMSDRPERMLEAWYVGDAQVGDADYVDLFEWRTTPVYDELKRQVRAYFGGRSYKATPAKWAMLALFTSLAIITYALLFVRGYYASLVLLPWLYWMGPASMLHDGTHFSLSRSPRVNAFCAWFGLLHMNPWTWYHQHVIAHHSYTNIKGMDADIQAFDGPSAVYGHRSSPFTPYRRDYRRWLRSLFVTMPFSCVQPALRQDFNVWWRDTFDDVSPVRVAVATWRRVAHFALHWAAYGAVMAAPFALFAPAKAVCFALVPPALYGCIYYVFSQVSHVNEDCFVSSALGGEWAVWQIRHSLDWGVRNWVWRVVSVALNLQTIHHLFPQIDSSHYAAIRPIVERVCAQFDVKLITVDTLADAARAHFIHLWSINSEVNQRTKAE